MKRLGYLILMLLPCVIAGCHGSTATSALPATGISGGRGTLSVGSGIGIGNIYKAAVGPASSVTVSLSPSPNVNDTEVAVIYAYNADNTSHCYTLTVPSGWKEYDSSCVGRHTIWTLTHTAGPSDDSYTFTLSGNDYISAIVYDLTGASSTPVDVHSDQQFEANNTAQSTATLTPSTIGDLAIASWGNWQYKDPTVSSPFVHDVDADGSASLLTTAHDSLSSLASISATAIYTAYPSASGMSNLILIAPAVDLQRPILPDAALTCASGSNSCIPGTGTSELLWAVETHVGDTVANCPGWSSSNCQAFNNVILNDCNSYDPSITLYANQNSHESDFTHTDSTGSMRYSYGGYSTNCASLPKLSGASNSVVPLLNYSETQTKSDIARVVTSSYIPSGGVFSDDHSFDYDAPLASYEICNGCGHTWISGGSSNISYLQNYADETNELSAYKVWLNSLSSAAGATGGACYGSLVNGHCYGDQYNAGTYDNRVRLDEFCNSLTGTNFTAIRQEQVLTGTGSGAQGGQNLGIGLSVLLDTVYDMRALPHCTSTVLIAEENTVSASAWMEPALTALQAMAPSSDGTPDEIVQQPYSYCIYNSCSDDTNLWPEMFIVPYGPKFTTSPYSWAGSSAHSATFCPSAGAPASQQGDSGGIQHLVLTCVAKDQPVLAAAYQHCYFLDYDTGACEWMLNTGTSSATVSPSGYSYVVNFTGCEFGNATSMGGGNTIAGMFPWISSSSGLYSALSAAMAANTRAGCNNGALAFSATLPTTLAPDSAVLLVTSKPPNY